MNKSPTIPNRKLRMPALASALLVLCAAFLLPSRTLAQYNYTLSKGDPGGTSALNSTTDWTPSGAPAPNTLAAASYSYYCNVSPLRTPGGGTSLTVYANPLVLGPSSTVGFKGYGTMTFENLVLNGSQLNISGTGSPTGTGTGSGDDAYIAGFINLTASSQIHGGGLQNGVLSCFYVSAVITNDASSSPNLTLMNGGVVELLAQNTFTGNIIVSIQNNSAGIPTVLQLGTNNAVPATAGITLNNGSSAGQNGIFDLHGFSATIASLNILSGTSVGYVTNSAAQNSTLTINNASSGFMVSSGTIAGNVNLVAITPYGMTLNNANTYSGSTTISSGSTLYLGSSGSINNSSAINIAAGATFDVSAISSYALGSGTTLSASGTGASPATINGASGGSVSLGAQPINLTYTPTTFNGDASDAALLVSQGDLTLNNNTFTVNNASGTPLGYGTYLLIQVSDGNINQNPSPAYPVTVTGSGKVTGSRAAIQVVGGSVNLVVAPPLPTPAFSNLTPSQSVVYGVSAITLSGTLSHGSMYPIMGEAINVSIDGNSQGTTINDNTGDFSISYSLFAIPDSPVTYTIYYSYGGDASLGIAEDTSTTLTVKTGPIIVQQPPSSTNVNENGSISIPTVVIGPPPLAYQWIDQSLNPVPGQTNASLNLSDVPLSANGSSYQLTVSNAYGSATSTSVTLYINSGTPPTLVVDLTPTEVAIVGTPYTYYVQVTGTEPFTYTWYENGVVIPGATSNSYPATVVCGTNLFYVAITNTSGGVTSGIVSSTNTTIGYAGTPPLTFPSSDSTGWTLIAQSQGAPTLSDGVMVITTGSASEGRAAWYTTPQNITAFLAQFTYVVNSNSPIGPLGPADGITFCIQNVGTNAAGPGAGNLGVGGISPSVEFDLNIYAGVTNQPPYYHPGPSIGWDTNGTNYAPVSTLPANLTNGNPMRVTIYYNGATASAWITDLTLNTTSPVVSDSLNIPSIVKGNTAYVGFTGGTGGSWAEQDIYDFFFATGTMPTLSIETSGANVVVSWPAATCSLYVLQSATQVQGPWTNVPCEGLSSANGQIQYTAPHTGAAMFYRLMLQQ
jgi:hypothetical protein